jgi:hypothetical protein
VNTFRIAPDRPGLARRRGEDAVEPWESDREDVVNVGEDRRGAFGTQPNSQCFVEFEMSDDLGKIEVKFGQSATGVVDAGEYA